jgi:hypothetical protein
MRAMHMFWLYRAVLEAPAPRPDDRSAPRKLVLAERPRGNRVRRARWALAAALLLAPAASGATTWLGQTRVLAVCPGLGSETQYDDFTLQMEPGSGQGTLTIVGMDPVPVATDWAVEGKWGYFSASLADAAGGVVSFYGWIKGRRMRGWVLLHDYTSGCMLMGRLRGWL